MPDTERIKIIDMGGATFKDEHHSAIINTRQYRAPEVILSCVKWDTSSDIWCIACIMMELYAGFNSEKNEKDIRRFILPDSQKRCRTLVHDREVLRINTNLDG